MTEFELKIHSRDINTLVSEVQKNYPEADTSIIRKAYLLSEKAHSGQTRLSGEPYVIHPLEVALILAQMKFDTRTVTAALLHDIVEDTGITLEVIEKEFSKEIADMVDGVTKISTIKNKSRETAQAETLRKMLIATVRDVRVIIIKLADKLHNMRTIVFQPPDKRTRIAQETLDIYAPIARRLGMSKISSELEDHAFHVLYTAEYNEIKNLIAHRDSEVKTYLEQIRTVLKKKLLEQNIDAEITGRAKNYFSVFRKMKIQHKTFDDIYDIRAIRILTGEIKDCYGALGVVHSLWSPITARFKDYIAVPKSNMYQSLHTTVIGPKGYPLEVQIRTWEMHTTAEMGIAAHWKYKENLIALKVDYMDVSLLKNITKLTTSTDDPEEFLNDLKMDLYEDEIFVFTPKGKIIKLGKDSTPLDFAYAIHTEIGHHCTGAKVNNKMTSLKTSLKSGDIVEILTNKNSHPSEGWLSIVKSSSARYKIRSWLKRNTQLPMREEDEKTVQHKLKKETKESQVNVEVVIPEKEQSKISQLTRAGKSGISIQGNNNVLIRLSQCCQPIPGDEVVGFITRGRGITVHKKNCPSLRKLKDEKERFIDIVWEGTGRITYPVKINIEAMDRPNLLKDVAEVISLDGTNILKADTGSRKNVAVLRFIIEVKSNKHLNDILQRIKNIKNVTDAYKLDEKVVGYTR